MQKVSYMGDDSTTEFYFNFPFYTNTDIVVLKNNQTATDYTIIGTSAGLNADIPYTGGKIVFNIAPIATDSITIYRHLPLTRTVDYQPTEKINPTILNQDMNYMMEVLKDTQDKIDMFAERYNEIINKESTDNLLSKIHYLNQLIDNDEIINKYVSNCITKIPQDIKLTLSSGTLTLKAGSKVYIPNGSGVFDAVTIPSDTIFSTGSSNNKLVVCYYPGDGTIKTFLPQNVVSGSSYSISDGIWYDTTNNVIKRITGGNVSYSGLSLPFCILTSANSVISSIDQVFNGFGFIGSTVFALPGVKGLVPNGRNADGTLKNITATISDVRTVSATNSDNKCVVLNNQGDIFIANGNFESETKPSKNWSYWYKPSENVAYNTQSGTPNLVYQMPAVSFVADNSSKITSFNPKTVFHAVDYSDTDFIAHQAMPSARYMDLTLPTSGQTVIAPADGYYTVSKSSTADNQYISIANNTSGLNVSEFIPSGAGCRVFIPVSKGDVVTINYTLAGTTNWFRFIYANGAK